MASMRIRLLFLGPTATIYTAVSAYAANVSVASVPDRLHDDSHGVEYVIGNQLGHDISQ